MDFVTGLPCTIGGYDAIWVIIDRLTKSVHFLPIKKTYSTDRLARLYINRIVCLHGIPENIVSDRGATFTSVFGKSCIKHWVLNLISVQFFIIKLMVSQKEPFRHWKIC